MNEYETVISLRFEEEDWEQAKIYNKLFLIILKEFLKGFDIDCECKSLKEIKED